MGFGPCHSFSSASTAAAASIKSADTGASSGSKLLFGEIDTGSEQSLENYASICDFVQCESSTFLRFWLDDTCRGTFLSFLPKEDLKAFRLTCHGISTRAAPALFRDLHITFRTNTFTKPAKMAALECIGHYVRKLSFEFPQTAESTLPPLVDPTSGTEMAFTYIPRVERSNTKNPKYGDLATTEALKRQYPALFHASTNASVFVRALSALPNLEHLAINCPGYGSRTKGARNTVEFALMSLRFAVERINCRALRGLSLSSMEPSALQYLMPHAGYGTNPASTRIWSRIQHLTLRLMTKGDRKEQVMLYRYLRGFQEGLNTLIIRWEDHRGPFPLTGLPHTAVTKAKADRISYRDQTAVHPSVRFTRLKQLSVYNAQASAAEINALIRSNSASLQEVELQDVELTQGEWQDVFATKEPRPHVKPKVPTLKTPVIPDTRPVTVKPLPALPLQSPRNVPCPVGPRAVSNRCEVHPGYDMESAGNSKKRRGDTSRCESYFKKVLSSFVTWR
ncbi:hypothetical protein KC343_g2823 [Hortaea werneckii]|nr:hypothetical protein KC352_g10472 [Hortaea werneckii]KAI7572144.1 hypothetical protein KC317_g1019 [Hortaea werneckii]KAI7623391.1 hypothetical protein KC346_g2764 [Hortaea werneckii]KAI7633643.1 hypothetical protein KC343_g2823 [Hortaea werneckii]KAI7708499.1 hypothetical protein KC322_g5037 [Hortaea werneckii]